MTVFRLRALEVVVRGDGRAGDFTGVNGLAVQRGDDADHVVVHAGQFKLRGTHAVKLRRRRGDDGELRGVDAIRARRENSQLTAFLAAVQEKLAGILKIIAINHAPEDAIAEEVRYWNGVSPSERVAAVETLRQRTPGIYGDAPSRLERVYRFVDREEGSLPYRRRARTRR